MKEIIGYVGIVIGIIAVGIAMFQDHFRTPEPTPAPAPVEESQTFKEQAIAAGKKKLSEKLFGKKEVEVAPKVAEVETISKRDKVEILYMSLGLLALALGVFSWAKKEHHRVASGAVALGLVAAGWEYVMVALVIAAVLFFLANLDFG